MKTIPTIGNISSNKKLEIPPDSERLTKGIRKIGYSREEAIADIIDNSIDAEAKNILIRFQISKDGSVKLIIADDGRGIDRDELKKKQCDLDRKKKQRKNGSVNLVLA